MFILLLLIGQLCVDLLFPLKEKVSEPLPKFSILPFKLEMKAQTSLFFLFFCPEVLEGRLEDLGLYVFTLLLQLSVC